MTISSPMIIHPWQELWMSVVTNKDTNTTLYLLLCLLNPLYSKVCYIKLLCFNHRFQVVQELLK